MLRTVAVFALTMGEHVTRPRHERAGPAVAAVALLSAMGCTQAPSQAPTASSPQPTGVSPLADSADTTDTAASAIASTADSSPAYATPFTPPTAGRLDPTLTIEGPEMRSFGDRLEVTPGDGHDLLFISRGGDVPAGEPHTYLLEAPWPRGRHHILDLWDGASGLTERISDARIVHRVPDADGDGQADYWLGARLVPGPLMGQLHETTHTAGSDSIAWIETYRASPGVRVPYGAVHGTDFDADGDGHTDVLVTEWGEATLGEAWVAYGPFSGQITIDDPHDPPNRSTLGWITGACYGNSGLRILRDYLGPGRDAAMFGGPTWAGCGYDVNIIELTVEPGGTNDDLVATFHVNSGDVFATDDVDGDGEPDMLMSTWQEETGGILPGPVTGNTTYEDPIPDDPLPVEGGSLARVLGDVNGDGINDYMATVDNGDTYVHLSPFDPPLVAEHGLLVERLRTAWSDNRPKQLVYGDFDGDGLGDYAHHSYEHVNDDLAHDVYVYTGADLVATWEAQGLGSTSTTP